MTAIDTTARPYAASNSPVARALNSIAAAFGAVATWNDARVTRAALSKLTDRELDDIGLSRSDIFRM
ncbi:MAG: DUF1127 domain-containing protein [Sagittula sp.]|uniref:DUF1127 domain-containing protein n=1 Tax=Sagittula sp. TaxID=2038081 RepID=UPI004058C5C0